MNANPGAAFAPPVSGSEVGRAHAYAWRRGFAPSPSDACGVGAFALAGAEPLALGGASLCSELEVVALDACSSAWPYSPLFSGLSWSGISVIR